MLRPRKTLICTSRTPFYHCVSRCVRRAFLCGEDRYTGKSYEHRRPWVEKRLLFLAGVFAVDLCAYAVMSNHTHVVLRINTEKARQWSSERILKSWHKLHRGTILTQRYLNDKSALTHNELKTVQATIDVYRERLQCISWFMRELNEFIARRANKEDECTGRFWEGRFKSQALLDEASVLACMAYVDLNPARTRKTGSIKNLLYTSLNQRLIASKAGRFAQGLLPLRTQRKPDTFHLWFSLQTYLQLLHWSVEHYTNNVKDPPAGLAVPELLEQTGLKVQDWMSVCYGFEQQCKGEVSRNKWAAKACA